MKKSALLPALGEASATLLAALATLASAWWLDPNAGAAVLAVVMCLSLARSQLDRDLRGRLEAAWAMPLLALLASGVALLLYRMPWVGAITFTIGIAASIWLRRFGPAARRAGSLIAVPLVAILTTPYIPPDPAARVPHLLVPMLIGLLALLWVSAAHALFRALRWLPPPKVDEEQAIQPQRNSTMRPIPSTRMALQMAVALAAAFLLGHLCFGVHWPWPVLTAFIVNSGNRGRLDVLHKSLLRLLGALAGTLSAALVPAAWFAHDSSTVALILGALFIALWLRPIGYAWWALFITLTLALLQDYLGMPSESALLLRLGGIAVGALAGVAAAWFVFPIPTDGVLRRRMGEALAALSVALDPAESQRSPQGFVHGLKSVAELAPALRSGRRLARVLRRDLPAAGWIDELLACRNDAVRLIERGDTPAQVRRAVGAARKALLEPAGLTGALQELRAVLAAAAPSPATDSVGR